VSRPPVPPELARGYLTADAPPVPGEVRQDVADFVVEEVPLYAPSGEGEHLYVTIEKEGISTHEAVRRLARGLGVSRQKIGHAGLKDARARTRQTLSLQGVDAAALERVAGDPQLRVLSAERHRNKLKVGHLRGNRFRLRIRGGGPGEATARAVLARLEREGVANYFGLQRFGHERHTHRLGLALVREDPEAFLDLLLGGAPGRGEEADAGDRIGRARAAARRGDYAAARDLLPRQLAAEQAACRVLAEGGPPGKAARAVAPKWRRFYVAALQSWLFNAYLTRRLDRIAALEAGEVATLHKNGAAFLVEDPAAEAPRCAAFEVSPSGPQFGRRLLRPADGSGPRADEDAVLADLAPGLGPELSGALGAKPQGQRRPLRVQLRDVALTREGEDLVVAFELPKGCYATAVLEELFKRQTD